MSLEKVFGRLQDAGFTVSRNKCEFFKREVRYLGHSISEAGLRKTDDKFRAILQATRPMNVLEASFLGSVSYYSGFVKTIVEILNPLYELLKLDKQFYWSKNFDVAFNRIKEIMATDQVLVHFDPELPIIVHSNASNVGISGCVSRKLIPAEVKYPTSHKETLSIIFEVSKFLFLYYYLCGNKFILKTDYKPLTTIFGEHKSLP